MASGHSELSQSATEMAVTGAILGAGAEGGVESGASAKDSACDKMLVDAWERPSQTQPGQVNLSEETIKKMTQIELMGAANPSEEDTLKQMKELFELPADATTSDINKKLDDFSRKMVKEAVGLCPSSSDGDVVKQLQELTIDGNMKHVGQEGVAESFGLPKGASREDIRDAAGKDVIAKFGLSGKYSTIDEKSIPELSKLYYDSLTNQIKQRLELKF